MPFSDDVSRRQIDEHEAGATDITLPTPTHDQKGKAKDIKSSTEASSAGEDVDPQDKTIELIKKAFTALLGEILS